MSKRLLRTLSLTLAATLCILSAQAQSFPGDRPITLIVPFSPGGPTDRVAHDLARAMSKPLGGTVVQVRNVPGAGSLLGVEEAARSTPDGHTLLLTHIGMATLPLLSRHMPLDVLEDFEYLGIVNDVPMTLVGRRSLPATDFASLRQWIQATGMGVRIGHSGRGSAGHLCALMLQHALDVPLHAVTYKGASQAVTELVADHIDLMCDQTSHISASIASGQVRAYAVTVPVRIQTPELQHLPTLNELGLRGFNVSIWHGLYAPRGTPQAVLARLNQALRAALRDAQFLRSQEALGAIVTTDSRYGREQHKAFVRSEIDIWRTVVEPASRFAD